MLRGNLNPEYCFVENIVAVVLKLTRSYCNELWCEESYSRNELFETNRSRNQGYSQTTAAKLSEKKIEYKHIVIKKPCYEELTTISSSCHVILHE